MMRNMKLMMGSGLLAAAGLLMTAGSCFGQDDERRTVAGLAILGGMLFVFLIFFAVFYVYFALALQSIAKKTKTENAWWAWIPILNILLMLNIAKKPLWWVVGEISVAHSARAAPSLNWP